jgi:hypothetical protein
MKPLHSKHSVGSLPWRLTFIVIPVLLNCFLFSPTAQAQATPTPTPEVGVVAYKSCTGEDNANDYGEDFFYFGVSGCFAQDTTINYSMSGTAVNGTDYAFLSGSAIFLAGCYTTGGGRI